MEQGPAGVTIHNNAGVHQNNNAGVHQNKNARVHQNANTHSPQSGHNDPKNDPTIKTENTIDVTGNENEAKNVDGNDAEIRKKMNMRT